MVDYATLPTKTCASLVFSGAKEIDEFPTSRRAAIAARVKALESEAAEAKKKEAKRAKTKPKARKAPDAV